MNTTWNTTVDVIEDNTTLDGNHTVIKTQSRGYGGIPDSFYISLGCMYIPGMVFNTVSLIIIRKDIKSVPIPTNVLLFVLCLTDLIALLNSMIWHVLRYSAATEMATAECSLKSVLGLFFPLFAGVNGMNMAADRFLALCRPFYYKAKITNVTWHAAMLITALILLLFCCLPSFGFGTIWSIRGRRRTCSTLSYHANPSDKTFVFMYGSLGLLVVAAIFVFNSCVVATALKLHFKLNSVAPNTTSQDEKQRMSCELQFAKLVGILTFVFVVCWTPFNVSIILTEIGLKMSYDVISFIHRIAGLNYVIDSIVYIFLRKTFRQKIAKAIQKCVCHCNTLNTVNIE